ncbi:MAG: response regulator transcription factor [Chloroflexi bacterium]|nr:MAG: response regulator transcription factor [Chloroflexota bacterium]
MQNGGRARPAVLLADDERDLLDLLAFLVKQAGLEPLTASDPTTALELLEKEVPAIAIVDLNLRPWDGFELLKELRRRSPTMPIIVLTARDNEDDKVRALDLGADDYVVKPFGHRELVARIRAQARRASSDRDLVEIPAVLEVGPLRLDPAERTLQINGEFLRLTGTEFRLMYFLMRNSDSVVPTAALAQHVWGYDDAPAREAVRVTVYRLRRKLRGSGPERRLIHTVPGIGLRLTTRLETVDSDRLV